MSEKSDGWALNPDQATREARKALFPPPVGERGRGEGEDSLTLSLSQRERESEVVPSMSLTLCIARRRCLEDFLGEPRVYMVENLIGLLLEQLVDFPLLIATLWYRRLSSVAYGRAREAIDKGERKIGQRTDIEVDHVALLGAIALGYLVARAARSQT